MPQVAEDGDVRVVKLDVQGGIVSNAYLLVCKHTGESVVIDTPGEAGKIMEQVEGTSPRYILITHSHFDHLGALGQVKARLQVPVAAHSQDAGQLPVAPDIVLNDGDTVSFGQVELKVMHTPGHTPGSLCFLTGKFLISGDTLFPGGPGKTASPEALRQIIGSIERSILVLPDDTQVFPGHGDSTVLKKEKEKIAVFRSRKHDPNLCGDVLWLSS